MINWLTPSTAIYAVACSLMTISILQKLYRIFRGPLSALPGPFISRVTNLVLKLHVLRGRKLHYVHSLHQRYGPVVRISPNEASVVDVHATKEIHKISGGFLKSPWYQRYVNFNTSNMFTMLDPKQHGARRRLLAQPLTETSLKAVEPLVTQKVDLAIKKMEKELKTQGWVDVMKWWFFMATDTIGDLTFGDSFRMLEKGKEDRYTKDLKKNAAFGNIFVELSTLFKLLSVLPLPTIRELQESSLRLLGHARQSLQRYKNLLATDPESVASKPMLFAKLFRAQDGGGLTDADMEAEAASYIIGGSDTTSITLTYLVWAVAQQPAMQEKLAVELAVLSDDFTYNDLRNIPYLDHLIDEALRLYGPAAGGLPRIVPPGGRTLGGHFAPEGLTVSTQAYTLHRNPSVFDEPETFRPSRWEKATPAMREAFMPFGGGTRICIGMHLARMELRIAVAAFFRAFPRTMVADAEGMSERDMEIENYFLIAPKGHRCLICTR